MIETDKKKLKQAEFTKQHTISPAELEKMIAEKIERARLYSQAVRRKRETVLQNDYR